MKRILLNTTCEYKNNEQRQWPTIKVKQQCNWWVKLNSQAKIVSQHIMIEDSWFKLKLNLNC